MVRTGQNEFWHMFLFDVACGTQLVYWKKICKIGNQSLWDIFVGSNSHHPVDLKTNFGVLKFSSSTLLHWGCYFGSQFFVIRSYFLGPILGLKTINPLFYWLFWLFFWICDSGFWQQVGGGLQYFLVSFQFGEMIQFDNDMFQMGWFNHQPDNIFHHICIPYIYIFMSYLWASKWSAGCVCFVRFPQIHLNP